MRKFILIDPSLCDVGGHYFEYAARVLDAAHERGFEPILAANRRALQLGPLPWPIFSIYRYGYFEPRLLRAIRWIRRVAVTTRPTACQVGNVGRATLFATSIRRRLFDPTASLYFRQKRRAFCADSLRLFREVSVNPGDVVFLPNACKADMLGLLDLFNRYRRTLGASWHLLFRRELPAERAAFRQSQRRFQQFMSRLNGHSVYLYTDTDLLTEQYNRLGVAGFSTLPIPVWSAAIHRRFPSSRSDLCGPSQSDSRVLDSNACVGWDKLALASAGPPLNRAAGGPALASSLVPPYPGSRSDSFLQEEVGMVRNCTMLHVVYLGDARTEKGFHWLPRLVRDAKAAELPVRFTIQSNFNVPGGDALAAKARAELALMPPDYGVYLITEPLASDAYHRLLAEADVVVLPYDPLAYAYRSSGVFVEALAAGKPVIVPAGTWMAGELTRAGSAAGAVFATAQDLTACLASIVCHYASFARNSEAIRDNWSACHSAHRLVDALIANQVIL